MNYSDTVYLITLLSKLGIKLPSSTLEHDIIRYMTDVDLWCDYSRETLLPGEDDV